ncbi:hypothetical protein M0P25_03040 [archaeon]|nr:hypothetical protein [archaeon]MDD2477836.1 hypothetical protein [Candidatus ainarchaeum sp.]MDD3085218.1 hypothetical protein [Candidatus ainarchaeum sp.]MDD4221498.1 hypothetical protein [Candidatus ainarchaeum sp.]MDD4662705.1 hypothetical protein [Candidatus ainarchaeum sp.]
MLYNYILRYPFSQKAKDFLKEKNIDLLSIDPEIIKKSAAFLLKNLPLSNQSKEKQFHSLLKIEDERISLLFVTIYPVSRLLLKVIDYNPLYQQFALYFQKQFKYFITKPVNSEEFLEISKDLCKELSIDTDNNKYYINLIDYLSYELSEEHKLQYANLEDGKVYFSKAELVELLSAILKKRILKNIDLEKEDFPKLFLDYGNAIKEKILKENTFNTPTAINKPPINTYPPCFLKMHKKLMAGERLTHIENFTFAVFLFNIGYNYDEILDLFKNLPNFDEKIAGYQIQKIIEKKYSVPSCDTLKSNGLCVNECNVKHPFQLFKFNKNVNKDKDNKEVEKK